MAANIEVTTLNENDRRRCSSLAVFYESQEWSQMTRATETIKDRKAWEEKIHHLGKWDFISDEVRDKVRIVTRRTVMSMRLMAEGDPFLIIPIRILDANALINNTKVENFTVYHIKDEVRISPGLEFLAMYNIEVVSS